MKPWSMLSSEQQAQADEQAIAMYLEDIEIGMVPDQQEIKDAIEQAWAEAEVMRTPWFFTSILWENELAQEWIKHVAHWYAVHALYPSDDEYFIRLEGGVTT